MNIMITADQFWNSLSGVEQKGAKLMIKTVLRGSEVYLLETTKASDRKRGYRTFTILNPARDMDEINRELINKSLYALDFASVVLSEGILLAAAAWAFQSGRKFIRYGMAPWQNYSSPEYGDFDGILETTLFKMFDDGTTAQASVYTCDRSTDVVERRMAALNQTVKSIEWLRAVVAKGLLNFFNVRDLIGIGRSNIRKEVATLDSEEVIHCFLRISKLADRGGLGISESSRYSVDDYKDDLWIARMIYDDPANAETW